MSPCTVRIHKEIYSVLKHPPKDFQCRPKFDDYSLEISKYSRRIMNALTRSYLFTFEIYHCFTN